MKAPSSCGGPTVPLPGRAGPPRERGRAGVGAVSTSQVPEGPARLVQVPPPGPGPRSLCTGRSRRSGFPGPGRSWVAGSGVPQVSEGLRWPPMKPGATHRGGGRRRMEQCHPPTTSLVGQLCGPCLEVHWAPEGPRALVCCSHCPVCIAAHGRAATRQFVPNTLPEQPCWGPGPAWGCAEGAP